MPTGKPIEDITGRRFHRLYVVGPIRHDGRRKWRCLCDCGAQIISPTGPLLSGRTRSCGCWRRDTRTAPLTHGMGGAGENRSKEYRTWAHIKGRCHVETDAAFSAYGGRGIKVCDRWRESFENFFADMGKAPSAAHSIDRIDNDGDYEPANCRWATASQQVRNRRNTIRVDGMCLKDICEERGISYGAAQARLRRGATMDRALSPLTGLAYRAASNPNQPTEEKA